MHVALRHAQCTWNWKIKVVLHLQRFCTWELLRSFAHRHLRWMCTFAASFGCALLANSHFHALCTFAKLSCLHFGHFCVLCAFARTHFLARVCSIVHFGDIVRLCKFTLSRVVHFCTAYVFALFAFCAFLCICTFETCLACALLIHFLDFRARAQVHFEVYVHFAHF